MDGRYKIGQLSKLTGLTPRTIRWYDELGLLKSKTRTRGGQRVYTDADLVYIRRIMELKALSFSLEEIRGIISLGADDDTGEMRRSVLLDGYKAKLADAEARQERLAREIGELKWHIEQLERAGHSFKDCPGALCEGCSFKENCSFRQ